MVAPRPWCPQVRPPLFAATLVVIATSPIRALPAQVRPGPVVELAVEQQVRDRWMHGRQQSRFTPFASFRSWLLVDSLRDGPGHEHQLYLTLGRFADRRDSAIVVFGADGRVAHLTATSRPPARMPYMLAEDSART